MGYLSVGGCVVREEGCGMRKGLVGSSKMMLGCRCNCGGGTGCGDGDCVVSDWSLETGVGGRVGGITSSSLTSGLGVGDTKAVCGPMGPVVSGGNGVARADMRVV